MAKAKASKPGESPADDEVPADRQMPEGDKPMTFWEHLEELRKRIIYSVVALVAAFFAAWEVKEPVLKALSLPYQRAWEEQKIAGPPNLNFDAPGGAFSANVQISLLIGVAMAAPVIFYQLWAF